MPGIKPSTSLDLAGSPGGVRFPEVCVACGALAANRVDRSYAFERWAGDDETPVFSHWEVVSLSLPVCPACCSRHEDEERPVPWSRRLASMLRTWYVIGMTGGLLTSLVFVRLAARDLLRGDGPGALVPAGLAAVFLAIVGGHVALAWRHRRGEWVALATSVTAALELGDDASQLFEPRHHAFRCANPSFAEAFREANADRVWDPSGPGALKAGRRRTALALLFIVLLFALLVVSATGLTNRP